MRTKAITLILSTIMAMALVSGTLASGVSDLQWGMTKDEVIAIMGIGSNKVDEIITSGYESLTYKDQKVSKYDDAGLILYFRGNALCSKMYVFDEDTGKAKYGYLLNALSGKYGEAGENRSLVQDFFDMMSGERPDDSIIDLLFSYGMADISTWSTDDNCDILLLHIRTSDYIMTALLYISNDESIPEVVYNDDGL